LVKTPAPAGLPWSLRVLNARKPLAPTGLTLLPEHHVRDRYGGKYNEFETRLASAPSVGVPAITLEGDANGAPHGEPSSYAGKFTGRYEHRTITGGIGHNLPQEAPEAFARAMIDVAQW